MPVVVVEVLVEIQVTYEVLAALVVAEMEGI
jgi:hypothetical protein